MATQARSPQGTYLARCRDWRVVIWESRSHQPIRVFANGYLSPLTTVNWSPDGRIVVAGSATGEILAWNWNREELLVASRYPNYYYPIVALAWSPVRDYLAALNAGNQIQVWDMRVCRCIVVLSCGREARNVSWSSDGQELRTDSNECWELRF